MEGEVTSYWYTEDELVFPVDTGATALPPWIIARRIRKHEKSVYCSWDADYELIRFRGENGVLKRYATERAAREALKKYAEKHGLKPAY